jgi:UDP-GlcNAc:undecaprenyl-phosphate/decaprenyl-phosphate GlcNAc-1-phosphate transferase
MKTVLIIFLTSFGLALLLTPMIARMARNLDLVDRPTGRKVHTKSTPRIGGVAIYLAFFGPFLGCFIYRNDLIGKILSNQPLLYMSIGATVIFLMGLADDIFCLRPFLKLCIQTAAAVVGYAGGISITQVQLPWTAIWALGWLSLPITVFWFLLMINGVNLIDGLDGLAAGIILFASLVLLGLGALGGKFLVAAGLAAIAGSCLGFLRYNFNPASIFMGDSGSYFLGYVIASLSVLGSIRNETATAILIPIIALGVPIFDVICAPLRRFIIGRPLFSPDKDHIHHRLLRMGFSQKKVAFMLYFITICLGITSLIFVYFQTKFTAIFFLGLGIGMIFAVRKIGYLEYLTIDKFFGWFRDILDDLGLRHHRRTFLGFQMNLYASKTLQDFWENLIVASQFLSLDYLKIQLGQQYFDKGAGSQSLVWKADNQASIANITSSHENLYISFPLGNHEVPMGYIALARQTNGDTFEPYILRRIEQLRRAAERALMSILQKSELKQKGTTEFLSQETESHLGPKPVRFFGKSR